MADESHVRSEIEEQIAKQRGYGIWSRGLFRYADGRFGSLVCSDRPVEVSPGRYSVRLDRWLVTIYKAGATLVHLRDSTTGDASQVEQRLTLDGDDALIDWWLREFQYPQRVVVSDRAAALGSIPPDASRS